MYDKQNKNLSFGVVGLGNIGKRHKAIIEKNYSLAWTCDINGTGNYTDIDKALSNECDVVAICTPSHLHYQHSLKAICAGYSVIIEKPVCFTPEQVKTLISFAEKMGVKIYPVKQNRLSQTVHWLKSNFSELGNIHQVQINCFWNRSLNYYSESEWRTSKAKSGGAVYTQFSHFIDILYYLFGYCEVVENKSLNKAHEYTDFSDNGSVIFKSESHNFYGTFNYSTSCKKSNMESSITIISDNVCIKIGGQYMDKILHCEGVECPDIEEIKPNLYNGYQGSASNHELFYHHVVSEGLGVPSAGEMIEVIKMCQEFS